MANNPNQYTGLCLSSGGIKGLAITGALTIFEMNGYLKGIKRFAGCSIGSIISLLLACGWKPFELYRRAVKIKLFHNLSDISLETLKSKHGLISNDLLRQELETLVLEKRHKLPTLLDFHNEGIYLSFSIFDQRSKTGKKLDWQSHPLLAATEGALMSSNMPVIFPPIDFEGMKVVDGALSNPFPVDYLDNQKDRILGIAVYGESDDEGLFNTLSGYLMAPIEEIQRRITRQASQFVDILEMTVIDISVMDLQASFEAKDNMFFAGLDNAKVMVRVLNKKQRREAKHRKHQLQSKKQKSSHRRTMPSNVMRVTLKAIPEEVIVKCLLSQPIDILLLAAVNHREVLKSALSKVSAAKFNQLRHLARQINDEPVKYSRRRTQNEPTVENDAPSKYGDSYKVKIEENHSQKIYDNLPVKMQSMAKLVFSSLSEDQVNKTVSGINIVVEGLNRLGINIFSGFLLQGPSIIQEDEATNSPREIVTDRVEIIPDQDFGKNPDGSDKLASDLID